MVTKWTVKKLQDLDNGLSVFKDIYLMGMLSLSDKITHQKIQRARKWCRCFEDKNLQIDALVEQNTYK